MNQFNSYCLFWKGVTHGPFQITCISITAEASQYSRFQSRHKKQKEQFNFILIFLTEQFRHYFILSN